MSRPKLKDVLESRRHMNGIKLVPQLVERSDLEELKAAHEAELEGIRKELEPFLAELTRLRAKNAAAIETLEKANEYFDELVAENANLCSELEKRKEMSALLSKEMIGLREALAERAKEVDELNVARAADLKAHQEGIEVLRKQFDEMVALKQEVAAMPQPAPAPAPMPVPRPQKQYSGKDIVMGYFDLHDEIDQLKRVINNKPRVSSSMRVGAPAPDVTHIPQKEAPRNEPVRDSISRALAEVRERAAEAGRIR